MTKTKAAIFFLFYLFASCTTSVDDVEKGLIACYPFDGNARDLCGNNGQLTVDGAVLTTDRFGRENSAYDFNGSTSSMFMEVNNMPAMDSARTVSWWYIADEMPEYDAELGAENMIVLVDSASGIGIQFGFRAPGYKTKGFDTWQWGGGTFLDMDYPEFGRWHHCAYTYDGRKHSFYLDGEFMTTSSPKAKKGVPNQLMLGNYPGGNQYFKGKLDEIRIFNRALSPEEINNIFNFKRK